jgi:hypothetical protein
MLWIARNAISNVYQEIRTVLTAYMYSLKAIDINHEQNE